MVHQSIPDNFEIVTEKEFEIEWTFLNSGDLPIHGDAGLWYMSGDYMHVDKKFSYDLESIVNPGEKFKLFINMKAPNHPGSYTAKYVIKDGKGAILLKDFGVSIVVKEAPSPEPVIPPAQPHQNWNQPAFNYSHQQQQQAAW